MTLAGGVLLLWPAVYNRFPLIFPDTDAYLAVTLGHRWTLDRSAFYGLALKPFALTHPDAGIWAAILHQAVAIAAIMLAVSRAVAPSARLRSHALILILVATLTTLPWHAAQIMPDAFTGALVLLLWLVLQREPTDPGAPILWLCVAALTLLHYTHLLIAVAVSVAVLAARAASGTSAARVRRNAIAAIACCSIVVLTQVASNGVLFNRWTMSPMGSYFLFARLQEDGLVGDWMKSHCGRDAPRELCNIYALLPKDSQVLLWQKDSSPLQSAINSEPGSAESWRWIDRLQTAAIGSIEDEPLNFASHSIRAGASQFVHFAALDDECPTRCQSFPESQASPELAAAIRQSRQVQGTMPRTLIRAMTSVVSVLGLILLLPAGWLAWRKRSTVLVSLIAAVAAALCANALVTGALSDVHDRYQSRVVWLAAFAVLLTCRNLNPTVFQPGRWRLSPIDRGGAEPTGSNNGDSDQPVHPIVITEISR